MGVRGTAGTRNPTGWSNSPKTELLGALTWHSQLQAGVHVPVECRPRDAKCPADAANRVCPVGRQGPQLAYLLGAQSRPAATTSSSSRCCQAGHRPLADEVALKLG